MKFSKRTTSWDTRHFYSFIRTSDVLRNANFAVRLTDGLKYCTILYYAIRQSCSWSVHILSLSLVIHFRYTQQCTNVTLTCLGSVAVRWGINMSLIKGSNTERITTMGRPEPLNCIPSPFEYLFHVKLDH